MIAVAGRDLDRQIERKLNGDAKKRTPPYSTSEKASNRLLRRLEMQDIPNSIEEADGTWYCTFWMIVEGVRERLSIGSGGTRALAVARAVMNARLGVGTSPSTASEVMSSRVHWAHLTHSTDESTRACSRCGTSLPARNRDAANRLCSVCSWRETRAGQYSSRKTDGGSRSTRISIEAGRREGPDSADPGGKHS